MVMTTTAGEKKGGTPARAALLLLGLLGFQQVGNDDIVDRRVTQ
jgi:hypothetical protein